MRDEAGQTCQEAALTIQAGTGDRYREQGGRQKASSGLCVG